MRTLETFNRLNPNLGPRPSSALYILLALVTFLALVCGGSPWCIAAVIPMIVINHAGHEAVHGCLAFFGSKTINNMFGWIAYAIVGQNFILMRWSHLSHHRFGRTQADETIDACSASESKLYYYAALLGASNYYHELAGYVYPLIGTSKYHVIDRNFPARYYRNWTYLLGQFFVLGVNICIWWMAGFWFLVLKIIFSIYWGASQNIAHYELPVGDYAGSKVASRTYRVGRSLSFLSFGSTFYHLEHHMFPFIPGPCLETQIVQNEFLKRSAQQNISYGNFSSFIKDCLRQYRGPMAKH